MITQLTNISLSLKERSIICFYGSKLIEELGQDSPNSYYLASIIVYLKQFKNDLFSKEIVLSYEEWYWGIYQMLKLYEEFNEVMDILNTLEGVFDLPEWKIWFSQRKLDYK